ncbi:histone-lysine N-methyltransferase SMYD3-like [Paramacrobiotus metropolitanus]|uniref:histone-lysine N-methyltransferase SMYD3-like n=1 Tax=Paramacrobiotus metropolitanus TaxID=2943436 RepID=UPI002445FFB4|nr:histone-lysine N-methyltransferase SMYD3-like [Paramacrobiotus metropolitanus]
METEVTVSVNRQCFSAGDRIMSCDPMVWMLERSAYKTHCAYCLQTSPGLRTCSGCQLHRYCNSACQVADWKVEHKLECALLKEIGRQDPIDVAELMRGLPGCPTSARFSVPADTLYVVFDLIPKVANKIEKNATMDVPGMGRKSVRDLLLSMPSNPVQPDIELLIQRELAAGATEVPPMDFITYCGILSHNSVKIHDSLNPSAPIGRALYPQAPRGRMTPVCWDANVALNCRGRRLVIHAMEDIPRFTGLQDFKLSY